MQCIPEVPITPQSTEIQSKQSEIVLLTKELRSHYYQGRYFVDPDKTFHLLLEKIITFFEKDDLPCKIQESEYLYHQYKDKHSHALQLIASLSDENSKLTKILHYARKKPEWFINQAGHEDTSLLNAIESDMDKEEEMSCPYSNSSNTPSSLEINTVPMQEYDKLKEEYLAVVNQKNSYENECFSLRALQSHFKALKEDYDRVHDANDNLNTTIAQLTRDNAVMVSQLNQMTKDKDDTYQAMTIIREKLNISESEKASIKIKNAHHLSKFKFLEKELSKAHRRNQSLNSNIKELSDKLHNECESQQMMQENYEGIIEEMENRMIEIENDKKRVVKDSIGAFIELTSKRRNNLTLSYNAVNDKIEIRYANELIGEVHSSSTDTTLGSSFSDKRQGDSKSLIDKSEEDTISRLRQLASYEKTANHYSTKSITKSPNKNFFLQKLFSTNNFSLSNHKLQEPNSAFDEKDKENSKNSLNLNKITLNSICKRQQYNNSIVIDKYREGSNSKHATYCNSEANLAHCILSANISKEGLTFTNSNTRKAQPKVFSLLFISSSKELAFTADSIKKEPAQYVIESNGYEFIDRKKSHVRIKQDAIIQDEEKEVKQPSKKEKDIPEMKSFLDCSDDIYYSTDMIINTQAKAKDAHEDKIRKSTKENGGKCNGCVVF